MLAPGTSYDPLPEHPEETLDPDSPRYRNVPLVALRDDELQLIRGTLSASRHARVLAQLRSSERADRVYGSSPTTPSTTSSSSPWLAVRPAPVPAPAAAAFAWSMWPR